MAGLAGVPGFAARHLMPTDAQAAMREKFLAGYFDGPPELRGNLKKALAQAGYSKTSITFKQGKFRRYVAEEEQKRGQSRTPQVFRDPNTGKVSFNTQELRGMRVETAHKPTKSSLGEPPAPAEKDTLPAWSRDPVDGAGQRIYFDHNGNFKGEENFGRLPSRSFADSYVSRYRGLDGRIHVFGDRVDRPIYRGLDLGDIFPQPVDLLPDDLPQAQLTKDSSVSQQIIQQATKGFCA